MTSPTELEESGDDGAPWHLSPDWTLTPAQRLYDVLDRLVHWDISERGMPEHKFSPLGSALLALHECDQFWTEGSVCKSSFREPMA